MKKVFAYGFFLISLLAFSLALLQSAGLVPMQHLTTNNTLISFSSPILVGVLCAIISGVIQADWQYEENETDSE